MNRKHRIFSLLAGVALASLAAAQSGGGYDLRWNTQDGGGTRMSGGTYDLNGTVGQPDANSQGAMVGSGGLTLYGGFWIGPGMWTADDVIFRNGFDGAP